MGCGSVAYLVTHQSLAGTNADVDNGLQ